MVRNIFLTTDDIKRLIAGEVVATHTLYYGDRMFLQTTRGDIRCDLGIIDEKEVQNDDPTSN